MARIVIKDDSEFESKEYLESSRPPKNKKEREEMERQAEKDKKELERLDKELRDND